MQTKQTFNQSITHTDNDKNVLERESEFRLTKGSFKNKVGKDGAFIHEINTGAFPQIYGSGALFFNAQTSEDPQYRHIYKKGPLNYAGSSILMQQRNSYGKFAQMHKLHGSGKGLSPAMSIRDAGKMHTLDPNNSGNM